jgi:hypothetical protein
VPGRSPGTFLQFLAGKSFSEKIFAPCEEKASGAQRNLQLSGVQQVLPDPRSSRDNSLSKTFKKIRN